MSGASREYLDMLLQDISRRGDEVIDAPEVRSLAAEQQKCEPILIHNERT